MSDASTLEPVPLTDRMGVYEDLGTHARLLPTVPIVARLDGRGFSRLTRKIEKPFCADFHQLMVDVSHYLIHNTGAKLVYTISDEISLLFHASDFKSQVFFDGRVQKLVSTLAAMASTYFFAHRTKYLSSLADLDWMHAGESLLPTFDCRAYSVPSKEEAASYFVWRQLDGTRNSVQMAAHALYSHDNMHGKKVPEMHEMLHAKGVNWNDYPSTFKRGTFVRRYKTQKMWTPEEVEKLPPRHHARTGRALVLERMETVCGDIFTTRVDNLVDVLYDGAAPVEKGTKPASTPGGTVDTPSGTLGGPTTGAGSTPAVCSESK